METPKALAKLKSVNVYAGPLGIMNADESGLPIMEESRSWDSLEPEWFQHLSEEDKNLVNAIINNNN